MNIFTIYSGISTFFSGVVLLGLSMIDVSQISNASTSFNLMTFFACVEFLKYVIVSLVPDVNKVLDISTSTHTHGHSGQKTHSDKSGKKIAKSFILMLIVTSFYQIIFICLGAPAFENFEETMMCCALLAALSFLPLCYYLGPNSALGVLFGSPPVHIGNFEAMLRQSLYVTLFGAWLGAFVIPLDWDRPWQKYPIPCILGGISSHCVFHAVSAIKGLIRTSRIISV